MGFCMKMTRNRTILLALCLAPLLTAVALACSVPVFRYALDRWAPDLFHLIIFHEGQLSPQHTELARKLQVAADDKKLGLNVKVGFINLATNKEPIYQKIWRTQEGQEAPRMVLMYPTQSGRRSPAWSAPLDEASIAALMDSPARREIAKRLLTGDSAVWILIDSGDKAEDEAKESLMRQSLGILEKSIEFKTRSEIEADEFFISDNKVEYKLKFSMLRLSRTDPAEGLLVNLLLNCEDAELAATKQPVMFPVFGRGRAYYAHVGDGINAQTIKEAATFLVGDCTCQVKNENPGMDLLMAVNWEEHVKKGSIPEKPLPELTLGLSPSKPAGDAGKAAGSNVVASASNPEPATQTSGAVKPAASVATTMPRSPNWLLIILGVIAVAAIITVITASATRKNQSSV